MQTYQAVDTAEDSPLTEQERADFENLEQIIGGGLKQMEAAGKALIEIRDRKLYRGQFRTFKAYVETKWTMSVRSAYQICGVAEVVENLRANGAQILPDNERQARELAKIPPDDQPTVWATVIQSGDKPTARKIEQVAVEIIKPKIVSPIFRKCEAIDAILVDAVKTRGLTPAEAFPPFVEDENDALKARKAMIDIWDRTDEMNRLEFLRYVFGDHARRDVKRAMLNAAKKKKATLV